MVARTSTRSSFSWQSLVLPFGIAVILLYMAFHAMNGDHGLYALFKEQRRQQVAERVYASLQTESNTLEHRVSLISRKTLDLDLLEEQARIKLGYAQADEKILLIPSE